VSSPDYPGIDERTNALRREFPWLTRQQAYVMAAVEIRPDRNQNSMFIGWDAQRRPVFERNEFGVLRTSAQLKNGNPTEPAEPIERVRPDFETAMRRVKQGFYGDWHKLRHRASKVLEERVAGTGCGISSSDVNHTIVGMIQSGDTARVDVKVAA
jgi:hypothetical protein